MAIAAIGQICSTASIAHNLEQCVSLVRQAAAAGAKVLFLPEASDYLASSSEAALALAQPVHQSPFVRGLQAAAQQHRIAVHVGIHVPVAVRAAGAGSNPVLPTVVVAGRDVATGSDDNDATRGATTKLLNRTIWIDEAGRLDDAAAYDKLHLFDYPAANLRESAQTQAGTALRPPRATPVGRVGSLTCFDLRFPEPSLALAQYAVPPAQILTYPSAFTVPTGRAHWEVLLRARAVESQCYVVAAAQVGRHNAKRVSYGRSLAVDPWGKVLCRLGGVVGGDDEHATGPDVGEAEEGAVGQLGLVDIDLAVWEDVRARMPLVRRTDVYPALKVL
ncbi:carbon-nitrogen family protein [Niveomyces insectorum RCEF 264]|uniref:Carbon-nitrogen family protein n=1 Tax=Niveomyces insectorum RCEF 264 TaxID=1081102 RepID=A0A167Z6N4_9HYPO|nr:carbon-nitrogen family protein [Niveomyces insectorum RCEF 264]